MMESHEGNCWFDVNFPILFEFDNVFEANREWHMRNILYKGRSLQLD